MIDEATLGWVAGILDFQGHIIRRNNKQRAAKSVQLSIYVETGIPGIPERLCELTGANPEEKDQKPIRVDWMARRCDEHCPEAHVHNHREITLPPVTKWCITGVALAIVLYNVRPYMVTTHEPWDWAMAQCFSQIRLTGQGTGAIGAAVRRLHSLGWELPPVLEGLIPKALEAS